MAHELLGSRGEELLRADLQEIRLAVNLMRVIPTELAPGRSLQVEDELAWRLGPGMGGPS